MFSTVSDLRWDFHTSQADGVIMNPYIASYSHFEIRPLLDVPLPQVARLRHVGDFIWRKNSVPDIQTR